jgi:hypothetical protein
MGDPTWSVQVVEGGRGEEKPDMGFIDIEGR